MKSIRRNILLLLLTTLTLLSLGVGSVHHGHKAPPPECPCGEPWPWYCCQGVPTVLAPFYDVSRKLDEVLLH